MGHYFQIGQLYNRKRDIHERFGGSRQSGISPCAQSPFIFIFTGELGAQYGYQDGWDEAGLFHYTGEGQVEDMTFTKGNKAIRDHQIDGRDILLFEQLGKSQPYRFIGEFACASYEIKRIPDREGAIRDGIVFHLLNVDEEVSEEADKPLIEEKADLEILREKAYGAAQSAPKTKSHQGKITYYERNATIKQYVLERSHGQCECCGEPAPFVKKNGTPYLEPHHILKLSDKGLDHPIMMAALTPNCHRRIHHGKDGNLLDQNLLKMIKEKEDLMDRQAPK